MAEQKFVLVVDDEKDIQDALRELIESHGDGGYACLAAGTLMEAQAHVAEHFSELAAVIIDGEVEGANSSPRSCKFVLALRRCGFGGPIMANSSKSEARKALMDAGCDFASDCKLGPGVASETPLKMSDRLLRAADERFRKAAPVH